MSNSKISALTGATTPLAGTEVLPIVQSSTTKQVSVANLTAGRAISATQLTLTTGNLIVANGQGVDFSATPGTGTSELFADYEEGTWTPTDGSGAGLTFSAGTAGIYTKIGCVVYISASVRYPVTASAANAVISGMPFTMAASPDGAQGGMQLNYSLAATVLVFKPDNGSTNIIVRGQSGGAQQTNVSMSGTRYDFNGFYIV
jgi:hypothetical protein